ncbi:MAG TPA: NADH-quinone oxidoreductase subunit N [Roseiflexaceae bacterium]|nr:NADH-quinone oxidoreductase subunit N [Roseiflexaceae bacterium]
MTFQMTDIPRILPELMLLVLALLVAGSDVLERWGRDEQAQLERRKAAGQLTAIGLGLVFAVALVQSRFLFTVPPPGDNALLNVFINLGRNLQAGGPGGQALLGAFATDAFTAAARLLFIGAALLATLLALDFRPLGNPGEFYALLILSTLGMCVMAAASELILAYLALELSSVALYVLAGYFHNRATSAEAGLKYFLFGSLSSGILLYGMSLAYGLTASANRAAGGQPIIATLFSEVAGTVERAGPDSAPILMALIFIVAGAGYKIAVVPFHSWSPDVYHGAPTPVTAFLSTASKAAGFLLLYRLLTVAFPGAAGAPRLESFGGWTSLLALLALATVIFGNLAALPQTNAKRLLAYSSIGHAGFALLALLAYASATPEDRGFGTATLVYYLVAYSLTNLGAFGALAAVGQALGGDDMAHLDGLARRNLPLATLLTLLVLSLAGIPPLAGFWAKFFVFLAGYQAGALWLVAVAVAMTLVALYYYLRFLKAMWINPPAAETPVPLAPSVRGALVVCTALVFLLGLFPNVIWDTLTSVAQAAR